MSLSVVTYKKLTTRDVVIFTTADWWAECTGNTTKFRYTNPTVGGSLDRDQGSGNAARWLYYTFWQYSATGIDQSRFSNTIDRLKVLATRAK